MVLSFDAPKHKKTGEFDSALDIGIVQRTGVPVGFLNALKKPSFHYNFFIMISSSM